MHIREVISAGTTAALTEDFSEFPESPKANVSRVQRVFLNFVHRFTAVRFTATGALPAAMRIRILPMNQCA
jgi:hypothetical protein